MKFHINNYSVLKQFKLGNVSDQLKIEMCMYKSLYNESMKDVYKTMRQYYMYQK